MKNSEKLQRAFNYFKKPYQYKMGGTQTIILPNGKTHFFDDRKYYSGAGSKFNKNIKHHYIGDVRVSRDDYLKFLKELMKEERERKGRHIIYSIKKKLKKEADKRGVYAIFKNYVVLSNDEMIGKFFDVEKLAKTLNIKVSDAELLKSPGKTYVFAKNKFGMLLELYHSDLSANNLSIYVGQCDKDRYNEFLKERNKWVSAPFAKLVGQTDNKNHFVC